MLELVHYLHIVSGATWGGAAIMATLVWIPAMQALPPDSISGFFSAAGKRARRIIGLAGMTVIITGLLRAYLGGGVRSLEDLWSPYGLWVLAALGVFFGMRLYGKHSGKGIGEALKRGEDPRPAMRESFKVDVLVYPGGVLLLLGIMVIMRMGLY
ncbi:hypothetical protein [Pelagibacterium lentulum]|uniref:Copper resistance protein D domain-containing protein n=1 Tax=Pelagibacterium lentulum TaxID=2029865 RepID=A0A916RBR3_9HYPH|nr:hypothetical protein [Pelagibacterium lentulum]GGA48197.1 hypothetical protein GCM10011499_17590 [Pelagibacterium lentulum]